jgi:hypothetical protein|tara:strand:+ start:362 stop:655 length:294 start_codon:yes stop_codon:yes gene_type:complete
MKTKTKNLRSRNGNFIANQFETIQTKKDYCKHIFQSYDTIIATIEYKNNTTKVLLDNDALNYSRTTSKYLYQFMYMNRKEIEKQIEQNKIKLTNLNK